jgi:hypothetical protein
MKFISTRIKYNFLTYTKKTHFLSMIKASRFVRLRKIETLFVRAIRTLHFHCYGPGAELPNVKAGGTYINDCGFKGKTGRFSLLQ